MVSWTLSGLFLVGAVAEKEGKDKSGNPGQIRIILKKSGKSKKGQKGTNPDGRVQIGKPPRG